MNNERLQIGYLEVQNRPKVNGSGILLVGEPTASIVNTTYSQLTGLKAITGLTPGQLYRISDFHLKWYNQSINDTGVKSGLAPEPLIVLALSGDKISHEAKSQIYPEDTVYYNIDASGSYSWGTLNNNKAIPDFKGWIYRRIDNKNNIDIGWDWRNITVNCCRAIVTGIPIYSGTTVYNTYDVVRNGAGVRIYYSIIDSNSGIALNATSAWLPLTPSSDDSGIYYPTDETYGLTISNRTGTFINLPADTGQRIQQPTFTNALNSQGVFTINNNVYDIEIKDGYSNVFYVGNINRIRIGYNFYNNLLYNTTNSYIGSNFYKNYIYNLNSSTIGDSFYNNICSCNYNIIGNSFSNNLGGTTFQFNTIGNNFINNTLGNGFQFNSIGNYFRNNKIGNNGIYNTFKNNFNFNTIGNNFQYNSIGNNVQYNAIVTGSYNTIGDGFQYSTGHNTGNFRMNTIENNISNVNFSGGTHLYAAYNTRVFKNSNQTVRLSYFNSNDQLVVTDPNA